MHALRWLLAGLLIAAMLTGAGQASHAGRHSPRKNTATRIQYGMASFYDNKFIGRRTASGSRYSQMKFTAAHNHVPLGTWIRVTNLKNRKTVIVRVTDRLHRNNRRIVDLSRAAATELGVSARGLLKVKVELLGKNRPVVKRNILAAS